MKQISCRLRFLTPAFLGDAEQNGAWRTPPIKALLRQFWRMAYTANRQFSFDVQAMRHEEGLLFGHAWLDDDKDERGNKVAARKSRIRIRLEANSGDAWATGTQKGVEPLATGLDTSYAWFGLIKRGQELPDRMGIKVGAPESVRTLHLACPEEHATILEETLLLMDNFGLLGSRSRGGWGSLQIEGFAALTKNAVKKYARPLDVCLNGDWAMSLAQDDKGLLLWKSGSSFKSWDSAMKFVATQRKVVRTNLKTDKDLRPALGFASPDGKRMASPLRWKLVPAGKELAVRVFAMPHKIPQDGGKNLSEQDLMRAWRIVANTVDQSGGFEDRR